MRVTQGMLNNNMLRNIQNSYSKMDEYMNQLATGKKINRPSDDPVVAMKGISYRSNLDKIEQYERNISEVHNWMDNSDEALGETGQALQRIRELVVQASNDTYENNQRNNIGQEIRELTDHIKDLANTKVNNKYIFNGTDTTQPRFKEDGTLNDQANLSNAAVNIEVSDGITLQANVNPDKVFSDQMFNDLEELGNLIGDQNTTGDDLDEFIGKVDTHFQGLVNERADLGARMNRVEMVEDRVGQQKVATTKLLSDNEDADIEEVIMNLKMQESVHRASLSAGARIIQPTLMDFLR